MSETSADKNTKSPSLLPILIAVIGVAVGMAFLLFTQFQKSTNLISAKFQAYQFMTDLQFYLMDDQSCTQMLGGNSIQESSQPTLKFPSGQTLKNGDAKGLVTINKMEFKNIEGGRENYYSAKLNFDLSIPNENASTSEFIKDRSLRFYFKSVDGQSLTSCGVKDMLSADGT